MRNLRFTIPLLFTLIILLVSTTVAKEYSFEQQRVYAVGDNAELVLNYFSGNLEITSHDVDRIVIKTIKRVEAVGMDEAGRIADNISFRVNQSRSKLEINTAYSNKVSRNSSFCGKLLGSGNSDPYGVVDFIIQVPRDCGVSVSNNTGKISISGLFGPVKVNSAGADIFLSSIEGEITVDNVAGTTTGELLFGPVTVSQPTGEVDLQWIEGDVRIKSTSAKINVIQERGAIDLSTRTGSVSIQSNMYTGQDCFVATESGNINLLLPGTLSGTLQISSDLGNIETLMPIKIKSMARDKLVGDIGDGGVKIFLSSTTGDVTVAEF